MKKPYEVTTKEIHYFHGTVWAESEKEAREIFMQIPCFDLQTSYGDFSLESLNQVTKVNTCWPEFNKDLI